MLTGADEITFLLARPVASDYDQLTHHLEELTQSVQREVLRRLKPALQAKIAGASYPTYQDKQELTKWLNAELRKFGLTLRWIATFKSDGVEEKRAYQAHVVTAVGNDPKEGRFQIRYRDERGKVMSPLSTAKLSVFLDHFDVMVDDPARHRSGKWVDRIARGGDGNRGLE